VSRLLDATEGWFGFGPADVWTLFHSYAFDFSVWEIWGCLGYGGRLVVVPYWSSRSPEDFRELLWRERVTVLNQTPSAFQQLIRAEESALAEGRGELDLRLVVFGGEALEIESLAPWWQRHGDEHPRLVNMYGITETTVHVTYRALGRRDLAARGSGIGAIGRPIPDLSVHLLDRGSEPVPIGVAGEIHVGGAGLALGYLGRPELTAERFVPDPWSGRPGERLYRSGDLARHRVDGSLDYLGRLDHQVKVRGFRIELGEIEAALAAHSRVAAAAVLAREYAAGSQALVAYVVPCEAAAGGPALATILRGDLGRRLPDYMVPSRFVVLERLPLTPNGKIDRKALAVLGTLTPGMEGEGAPAGTVTPRTPGEEILVGIWEQLLDIGKVGVYDNFFELGGHSLLATRLAVCVQQAFGVALPLRWVFEAPTVAALAARIAGAQSVLGAPAPAIVPMSPASREAALPLSFAQERLWFIDQFEPGRAAYNVPLALRAQGVLDVGLLGAALAEVVRRHEALRTTFAVAGGQAVQVIAPERSVPLPVVDLSALPEAVRDPLAERLLAAGAWRPFDLAAGPLLRAMVLRLEPEEHTLLITLHHIVSDGWSMEVLIREIVILYRAFWEGRPSPLSPLPIQYADFAVWQRQWLTGEVLEAQLAYWRERLAG
ncbi:MAG TPA: condensation domain-containing protein, partial [Thermoanaerobaculia bacterium]|nr:condensation domain-containing protein [Thermoanaerobaculia bacterium]